MVQDKADSAISGRAMTLEISFVTFSDIFGLGLSHSGRKWF